MRPQKITSLQNPRIKALIALRQSKGRHQQQAFLVEGHRELSRALLSGWRPRAVYHCPEYGPLPDLLPRQTPIFELSPAVFDKAAVRAQHDGLLATFGRQSRPVAELLRDHDLILALEGIEKPGNIGAIFRSADAFGAAVLMVGATSDADAPQSIRASLGTYFSVPSARCRLSELRAATKASGHQWIGAALGHLSRPPSAHDLVQKTVVFVGSEDRGLSAEALEAMDALVEIPMAGIADSLNVSVAAALLLYESRRQRGTNALP